MTKEELKDYLVEEADYTPGEVDNMSPMELFNAYLEWNGICGWNVDILNVVLAAFPNMKSIKDSVDIYKFY